jgi:hypothetical protein
MKKLVFLLSLFILFLNNSNAQCKKVNIAKLVQLRTLEEKEYKKALEELGFIEDKKPSIDLSFNRECTNNGNTSKESLSRLFEDGEESYEIIISFYFKDKSTFEQLKKQISTNKKYAISKSSTKNETNYKSKKDYIMFTESNGEFVINISNSF